MSLKKPDPFLPPIERTPFPTKTAIMGSLGPAVKLSVSLKDAAKWVGT